MTPAIDYLVANWVGVALALLIFLALVFLIRQAAIAHSVINQIKKDGDKWK